MKKTKKILILLIAIILTLFLAACGANTAANTVEHIGEFTVEQIQDDPHSFLGEITIIGVVTDSDTMAFAVQNEEGTFAVRVDYRGSRALPQIGELVAVEGLLYENRPCCGPGFTIASIYFEVLE